MPGEGRSRRTCGGSRTGFAARARVPGRAPPTRGGSGITSSPEASSRSGGGRCFTSWRSTEGSGSESSSRRSRRIRLRLRIDGSRSNEGEKTGRGSGRGSGSGQNGEELALQLFVPVAVRHVVVHHAHGLHERVADRRAHEPESLL